MENYSYISSFQIESWGNKILIKKMWHSDNLTLSWLLLNVCRLTRLVLQVTGCFLRLVLAWLLDLSQAWASSPWWVRPQTWRHSSSARLRPTGSKSSWLRLMELVPTKTEAHLGASICRRFYCHWELWGSLLIILTLFQLRSGRCPYKYQPLINILMVMVSHYFSDTHVFTFHGLSFFFVFQTKHFLWIRSLSNILAKSSIMIYGKLKF